MTCKHAANATRDANFTSWNRSRWLMRLELQTVRTVRLSAWLWGESEDNNFAVFLFLVVENWGLGNAPQRRLKLWTCPSSACSRSDFYLFLTMKKELSRHRLDGDDDVIGQSHRDTSLEMRHQQTGESCGSACPASRRLLRCVLGFYRCGSAHRRSDWLRAERWLVQSSQQSLVMKSLRETLPLIPMRLINTYI